MLPRVPGEPTPQQAVAMAPRLIQEVHAASGRAAGEPLRRADWDAYLQDTLLSAQRNLPPERQVQVLASVDRIRTAGLQRFVGLAVAAAQANDMEGVARAMNGASSYVPDGYQDQFRAVQGGLQISRTPEEGQRGQQQTMIANPQQVAMYAMRMMDPAWSMTHELGIRRQDEVERHNRADEGLRGAAIAETRASRGERTAERNAEAGAVRAGLAVTRAEDAVEEARRGGSQEEITAAQTRLREARAARDEAEARGGVRGLQVSAAIEDRRDRERIRRQEAEDRATGRTAFTPAEREAVTAATETMSGDRAPPGSTFARSWLSDTFSRNRNVDPNVLGDALRRMGTGDGTVGLDPRTGRIVDRTSGRSYQASPDLQELIRSRSGASGGSGGGSNSPTRPAPLDEGRAPSGRRSSLSAAEEGGSGAGEGVATSVTIPRDIERRAVTRMTDVNQDMTAGEARSRFRAEVSSRVRTLRREAGIPDRPTAVGRTQWNAANDRIVRQAAEEAMRQLGGR